MKQFILFGGTAFYPEGGANDFVAWFDDVDEAITHAQELQGRYYDKYDSDIEWWQLVRVDTMTVVAETDAPMRSRGRPVDGGLYREID